MSSIRTTLKQALAITVATTLCACAFTLERAKPDLYVRNETKVRKVLAEIFEIPESRVERGATLSSLGMVPGKNDVKLQTALQNEFQMAIPLSVIDRNPDFENLVAFFSDERNVHEVTKEKMKDFGPIAPQNSPDKTSKPDETKTNTQ